MRTALICVDVQRDFLDGALGAEGRSKVVAPLTKLAFSDEVDLVVASQDWHPPDHCSFAKGKPEFRDGSWPPHCVRLTEGARLNDVIRSLANVVVRKGMNPDREAYSAFDGSIEFGKLQYNLAAFLDGLGIERLIIGGIATDKCVLRTVLDALELPWPVVVPLDACAGINGNGAVKAASEMKGAGARVVSSWEEAFDG